MRDNNTTKWSSGIKFVQFQKNRRQHEGIKRSPYEAMFGCPPKVGLTTSSLPNEILNLLSQEEDLETYMPPPSVPHTSVESVTESVPDTVTVEPETSGIIETEPGILVDTVFVDEPTTHSELITSVIGMNDNTSTAVEVDAIIHCEPIESQPDADINIRTICKQCDGPCPLIRDICDICT